MPPVLPFSILVHGGAGRASGDTDAVRAGCTAAADAGYAILQNGGSALDAVTCAVTALEDDPLFNAGTGATLNSEGHIELDAAIMDGATRRAGAVAALTHIRNPIQVARKVLDDGRHVLLVADGARAFARSVGIAECDERVLIVDRQRQRWQQSHGTVGAVARDRAGRLAAATSTGGIAGKLPGRVGDSPLIGAGTYADRHAAVSCTGTGEAIIRATLAAQAAHYARTGLDAQAALVKALQDLDREVGGDAGLIMIDAHGQLAYARNTEAMPVCYAIDGGISCDV